MLTLSETLRQEQARCRRLALDYQALGSTGFFGAAVVEEAVKRAEEAIRGGNVLAMRRALASLKDCQPVGSLGLDGSRAARRAPAPSLATAPRRAPVTLAAGTPLHLGPATGAVRVAAGVLSPAARAHAVPVTLPAARGAATPARPSATVHFQVPAPSTSMVVPVRRSAARAAMAAAASALATA
jgi:hypothetical protein